MKNFSFMDCDIEGLKLITPFVAEDIRGRFIKDYSETVFLGHGINHPLKEVFYTVSHKGVVRAIHFQREKQQAKLVRCISGRIFDICVDLRKNSSTFGKGQGFYLSSGDYNEVLIPEGCGHGYLVLEESVVSYKCNEVFYGEYDDGIIWNDTDISVDWPVDEDMEVILSEKDKNLMTFREFVSAYGGF